MPIENKCRYFPPQREKDGRSQERESMLTFYFMWKKGAIVFIVIGLKKKILLIIFVKSLERKSLKTCKKKKNDRELLGT